MKTTLSPSLRRILRDVARLATAGSAVMATFATVAFLSSPSDVSAAGELLGAVTFRSTEAAVITTGGSAPFAMNPPANAACPGGASTVPSYRWQTFFVSASVDVGAMTFTGSGPSPITDRFVSPMYDPSGVAIINQNPAATPTGLITGIPTFAFAFFEPPDAIAPGEYKVGFACTTAGTTVSYWQTQLTITADSADAPAGVKWTVNASTSNSTTSTTTTTTVAATTTTTIRPATTTTTTTVAGATTTTAAGATTTLVGSGSPTTTIGFTTLPATGGFNTGSNIPVTGPSHAVRVAVWAILMLVFGRMAVLLARPIKVLPPEAR